MRMEADAAAKEQENDTIKETAEVMSNGGSDARTEDEEEEEEEEEEEPRLKYISLTKNLGPVYRNGDATSAFMVAGDKMIIGTHNGHIHVLALPSFQSLKYLRAHSATITAVSISPFPLPLPTAKPEPVNRITNEREGSLGRNSPSSPSHSSPSTPSKGQNKPPLPATPWNSIHMATSSIDGKVCIASLVDPKDVLKRDFGRPVQAVALSPDYKNDRTYLSGGLAGNLIMTVGGRAGTSSTSNTIGGAAATATGWLGQIGLAATNGVDTVLHSGEGPISTIKWSLSGRYILWVNEQGIKIMRSNLHLESADADLAWKRINHVDRPGRPGWEEMASVWKARVEWIDRDGLESDEDLSRGFNIPKKDLETANVIGNGQSAKKNVSQGRIEKVAVGWGDAIWIIDVHPAGSGSGKETAQRRAGHAQVLTILRTDCIISGISLYTPNLLLVLAYITPDEEHNQTATPNTRPSPGFRRRQNALQPEMRIIDTVTKEEISTGDTLNVSRFESLSATDYHLGVLPAIRASSIAPHQRGALEIIGGVGGQLWDATLYPTRFLTADPTRFFTADPTRLFSSAASVQSSHSNDDRRSSNMSVSATETEKTSRIPHPSTLSRGMKIFIQSPYDCVLATKPTLADHLAWLELHEKYEDAWGLLDEHPEAIQGLPEMTPRSSPSTPTGPQKNNTEGQASLADFFADDSSQTTNQVRDNFYSQVEKEKKRIGENWVKKVVKQGDWDAAGKLCGQVLQTSSSWEHWVWVFAQAQKHAEIAPYIPTTQLQPPLPSTVYETVLGHYISRDRVRLKELLERWQPELFDVSTIITAIEGKLRVGDVRENTVEGGEVGRDWQILTESLAKLYLADGRAKDALRCYIKLQDADEAMHLIAEYHLIDTISDDIPSLILLRVPKGLEKTAPIADLEELTSEPIRLLVGEAHHGLVRPKTVVSQLEPRHDMRLYLYFYLRALWNGDTSDSPSSPTTASKLTPPTTKAITTQTLLATEGKSLVSDFADLAVSLFADYSRPLLLSFLKTSQSYTLSLASQICEQKSYIPELVFLLAKEGRTKQALFLIIDKLGDVSQAISFAKEQDDPDLWNDLLDYSMNKPSFIRALLEEVGTSINPITLVRRIPEGLEIEGLRDGLSRMIKEYELQDSISEGVARVLRGEVAMGMNTLRTGQKKGVKFEVVHEKRRPGTASGEAAKKRKSITPRPGYCSSCGEAFTEDEKSTIFGFSCSHIFHLSCFLTYSDNNGGAEADLRPPEEPHRQDPWNRSVGSKIAHAKELRGQVRNGCPLSVHKDDA
ncbi:MAG: Vacuolar protein sorting-associated protein 41 [Icmadophila ericetorum]|nr:Vacuolar protein sorting-associated protein 41 [Icmadophila ericetorum]